MMFIIKKTSFIVKKTSTVAFPVNFCLMTVALLLLSKYDFVSDIRRTNWKNGKIINCNEMQAVSFVQSESFFY